MWLSEDEAHRLLARAVELDARDNTNVSLTQLREVAKEAGIASDAFELALRELKAGASSPVSDRAVVASLGLTASQGLAKHRRLAFLLIFLASAAITPGDVIVSTLVFSLRAYGLYEISILVSRWVERRRGRPMSPPPVSADVSANEPTSPAIGTDRSLLFRTA